MLASSSENSRAEAADDEGPSGARAVFSALQRRGLLAAFALIVVLRLPHAWEHGRFQDEEATVFLAYAWHHPLVDALFRPFAGYLNLGATVTTVVVVELVKSGVLALERAPYVTMALALAVQLLPAVLILSGRAQWLASRPAVITSLLMIAILPATEEVFFNVMHIQFHLALCVGLILALDLPHRTIVRTGYGALLFLAPLCGPGAIVLLPLFALRALLDRSAGRGVEAGALIAGAAVQLLLFYGSSPVRGYLADPPTIAAAMFVRLIALPELGTGVAERIGGAINASQIAGNRDWMFFGAAAVLLFAVLIVIAVRRRDAAIWLILSGLSLAVASLGFGIATVYRSDLFSIVAGERYNFLPLVLLGLALIVLARRSEFAGRPVYMTLCLLMLLSGAVAYPQPYRDFADGPSWPAEVRAWRSDHHHQLAVWPKPWTADLSDETRPCPPPSRNLGRSNDLRYCESGWIDGFYRQR